MSGRVHDVDDAPPAKLFTFQKDSVSVAGGSSLGTKDSRPAMEQLETVDPLDELRDVDLEEHRFTERPVDCTDEGDTDSDGTPGLPDVTVNDIVMEPLQLGARSLRGTASIAPSGKMSHRSAKRRLATSAYFNDGVRTIDFVLAYRPSRNATIRAARNKFRAQFEKMLKNMALEMEYESPEASQDGRTAFIKIHATWAALTRRVSFGRSLIHLQAEYEKLQMPTMPSDLDAKVTSLNRRWLDWAFKRNPCELQDEYRLQRPVNSVLNHTNCARSTLPRRTSAIASRTSSSSTATRSSRRRSEST